MDKQDEHLATIRLKDGSEVDLIRAGKGIRLEGSDGAEVNLPRASAQQAVDLMSLFEGLGGVAEFPDDEEESE